MYMYMYIHVMADSVVLFVPLLLSASKLYTLYFNVIMYVRTCTCKIMYVSVTLFLCFSLRLVTDMQSRFSRSELVTPEPRDVRWDDFVADLWDQRLPHFRQQGFVYSKATGTPPHARLLGEGDQSSILNELIHYSSETNLLTIFEEEPPFLTFPDDQMLSPSPVETSAMLRSDSMCTHTRTHARTYTAMEYLRCFFIYGQKSRSSLEPTTLFSKSLPAKLKVLTYLCSFQGNH